MMARQPRAAAADCARERRKRMGVEQKSTLVLRE
jgi:hypothetical protein